MTDPNGPSAPGWNQGGWPPPTPPQPGAYPETQQYNPGAQPYAGAQQYPGAQPYGAPYPDAQQYPGTQQYPGNQQYPGAGPGYYDTPPPNGFYGGPPPQGPPAPRRSDRMWIIIAAVVAVVAVIAAVVVVVVVNRGPDPNSPIAQGNSAAAHPIPDGSAAGVSDTITLDGGDARVGRVAVVAEFEHAIPSEVSLILTSPEGREAVIRPRVTDGGPRVRVELDSTQAGSPLVNLQGGPVAGSWRLTARDSVAADAGTLLHWDVTVYPAAADAPALTPQRATGASTPGLPIPDNDSYVGVSDTVALSGYGNADRISVDVRITHPLSGDLVVVLISPEGDIATLSEYQGGLGPNVALSFDSTTPGSPLTPLVGQPLAGPWELVVRDQLAADLGTFDSWEIVVNG